MHERHCRQFGRIRKPVSSLKRGISAFFVRSSKKPTSESSKVGGEEPEPLALVVHQDVTELKEAEGSGSCEKDSPIEIIAVEKQEQTGGRSMTTDLEKERVMRTKRASRWRSVFFHRSTWAVSPVSFPTAVCCSSGITAAYAAQKSVKQCP
jgi:hypothetical protein